MRSSSDGAVRGRTVIFAVMMTVVPVVLAPAAELMPVSQQNALVQKYCAVCHTDAVRNGGLSLQHFDAAQAPPSLTAMMLSKLTGGVTLQTARTVDSDRGAAALTDQKMKTGAMGAAGIPIPDKVTIDALIRVFAIQSVGATDWTVERAASLTASILQELPSASNAGEAEFYRLVISCNPATRQGDLQLAWSPVPQSGTLSVSVDGKAAVPYPVEGSEAMGNRSGLVLHRPASLMLAESKGGIPASLPFPAESLAVHDLFPGETVTFPFTNLPKIARQEFNACFSGANE